MSVHDSNDLDSTETDPPLQFEEEKDVVNLLKRVLANWGRWNPIRYGAVMELTRDQFLDTDGEEEIDLTDMKEIIGCSVTWPDFINLDRPFDFHILALIPDKLAQEVMQAMGEFEELHYSKRRNILRVHKGVIKS